MLLREMFSPIGAPKEQESDIDWIGDLKFFIDNDTDVLSKMFGQFDQFFFRKLVGTIVDFIFVAISFADTF